MTATVQTTFPGQPLFSGKALARLILPLILEQLLVVTVGMADTVMVAGVGEAAVSAVSLVDQINVLLVQVFAALATGGAVVASQYLGRRDYKNACASANQLLYSTLIVAVVVSVIGLVANRHLLGLVFGGVPEEVMRNGVTYFWISALSYPFLAIYNAGAALFRSMGNSKVSLFASVLMNIINIGGNALLIFVFDMGVAGAATASLVARITAAVVMLVLLHKPTSPIHFENLLHFHLDAGLQRSILRVGVPTGVEGGMFQIGKLLVTSLVASLGLAATTANAICNSVGAMVNVPGSALGLAMVTVVGQCVGARDYKQARWYTKRMMLWTYLGMAALCTLVWAVSPILIGFFAPSAETRALAQEIMAFFCLGTMLFWPPSFALPNALRAAGDARFTMTVSMVSMWLLRVAMSYVLVGAGFGLAGIWLAMILDWVGRDVCFIWRAVRGKWEKARVLDQ